MAARCCSVPARVSAGAGTVGRLTLHPSGEVGFLVYADPRLRCAPQFDRPVGTLWAWRLGGYHFSVRRGVILGANGVVVTARRRASATCDPDRVRRSLRPLCHHAGGSAACIHRRRVWPSRNLFVQPREDGYRSLGGGRARLRPGVLASRSHRDRLRFNRHAPALWSASSLPVQVQASRLRPRELCHVD